MRQQQWAVISIVADDQLDPHHGLPRLGRRRRPYAASCRTEVRRHEKARPLKRLLRLWSASTAWSTRHPTNNSDSHDRSSLGFELTQCSWQSAARPTLATKPKLHFRLAVIKKKCPAPKRQASFTAGRIFGKRPRAALPTGRGSGAHGSTDVAQTYGLQT
jgi:hypothetical protein